MPLATSRPSTVPVAPLTLPAGCATSLSCPRPPRSVVRRKLSAYTATVVDYATCLYDTPKRLLQQAPSAAVGARFPSGAGGGGQRVARICSRISGLSGGGPATRLLPAGSPCQIAACHAFRKSGSPFN